MTLRGGFWHSALAAVIAVAAPLYGSCATHSDRMRDMQRSLDLMQPERALAVLNDELDVSNSTELPDDLDGDNALLILDRAMVLQQLERYRLSSRDLEAADKQIEVLDLGRNAMDEIGRYLFSDDVGRYKAPAYEKLMINTMNIINYLARGDLSGARIEARRLAVMQRYIREHEDPADALLGPGSYLAGFAFEKSGRADEALRYYDEALAYAQYRTLHDPVRRLASQSGYRSPRIRSILEQAPDSKSKPELDAPGEKLDEPSSFDPSIGALLQVASVEFSIEPDAVTRSAFGAPPASQKRATDKDQGASEEDETGEIFVTVNFGRVPAKHAKRIPIGLALTYAAPYLSPYDHQRAAYLQGQGLVTWLNYPELGRARGQYDRPEFALGRDWQLLEGVLAVDREMQRAWERARGAVVGAALTRMIARIVAGEAVRRGAGEGLAGALLSLGTQATLTALDKPDTRSWSTLPARMAFGRARVPAGTYSVRLGARGVIKRERLVVKPGKWAMVNLTVLG